MKKTTVPAAAFAWLGERHLDDPAVVVTDGESIWCEHPLSCAEGLYDPDLADRVLVEQSEGALLWVLARHLGWDGDGHVVLRREDDKRGVVWWVVRNLTEFGLPPEVFPDDGPLFFAEMPRRVVKYKHSYHEALAAAVVWFARLERVRAGSDATVVLGADPPADLEAIEASFGLDLWRVEVTS